MSQENVAVVRAALAAWNSKDMAALREVTNPDAIVRPPRDWPEPGPFVGRDAVMRQFEQVSETWDADALEPVGDFIEAGDHVVVRLVWHGEGRGPDLNAEWSLVYSVRDGMVFELQYFWDHAEALEAIGLSD